MTNDVATHYVIEAAIEARSATDAERLARALPQIASEEPAFRYATADGAQRAVVLATDEECLIAYLAGVQRLCANALTIGKPRVRYREGLARAVEVDYTHKRLTRTCGEFARVKLRIEPSEPGTGSAFGSEIVGGAVPDAYIGGVEQGVRSVCDSGVLAGFPIDARVSLRDGAYHQIDSSWAAFEIAGLSAMRDGALRAGVRLLEPVMDLEVTTPPDLYNAVVADMENRHIRIRDEMQNDNGSVVRPDNGREACADAVIIRADAPLARLLGYAEALRSIVGRPSCTISFNRYAEVESDDGHDDFAPAIGLRA